MLNRFQTGANKEARTNRSLSWPSKAEARMTETLPPWSLNILERRLRLRRSKVFIDVGVPRPQAP
jgi:hypothetical protein